MYNDQRDLSKTNEIKPDQNWWQKRNIGSKGLIIGGLFGLLTGLPGIVYGSFTWILYYSLMYALYGLMVGAVLGVIRFFLKLIFSPFKKNKSPDTDSIPQTTQPNVESKKFCPNCNIQMDLDAIFCTSCGIKIT